MAVDQTGIMALPENQGMAAPPISLQDSYGAMREALQEARPDADMELQESLAEIKAEIRDVSDEDLNELIFAIQALYNNPETYKQEVAELVADGDLDADDLPAEYDEEFLSAMLMVLIDEQRSRETAGMPPGMAQMMPPPQQFARGGIAEAARIVASKGRGGDTMLAHITPEEARLLKSRGGAGTINPQTGLPEFFLKKLVKSVGKVFKSVGKAVVNTVKRVASVVKKALKSPIGRILGTIALGMVLGPAVLSFAPGLGVATAAGTTALTATGSAVVGGLSSGIITAASGGSVKDILKSAALGSFSAPGGPVSNYVGKYTGQYLSNPVVQQAANAAIIGTSGGLLTGESLKDSLKTGLTQGVIAGGITLASGGGAQQVKDNAANTAMDAVDDAATQKAIADFEGPSGVSGTGAQRAGSTPKYVKVGDGWIDTFNNTAVPPAEAARLGLGTSAAPTDLKSGIFGTPTAKAAYGFGPDAAQAAAPVAAPVNNLTSSYSGRDIAAAPVNNLTSSYSGRDIPGMPNPDFDLNANLSGSMAAPPSPPGFYDTNVAPLFKKAGDLYDEYLSPSGRQKAGIADARKAYLDEMAATGSEKLALEAYNAAKPGIISTYGPITAAGIGALGLAGGFSPKPPPETEFANQMRQPIDLSGDPSRYYIQGLPGVQYDERGAITGSSPYGPTATMRDIQVETPSYIGYNPMMYRPMQFNMGGIAALKQGGYPRRTGQISGPGTEKSDSIPAMLSDGEFVMTAKAVRGAGGGSRRDGAKRMYALMHQLERNAARG
jgi:hypothetical protein